MPDPELLLLDPEASLDDCGLLPNVSLLPSEKLVALRARLLRSLLFPLPPASRATGLSRSTPNCSKERLKEVVVEGMES